MAAAHHDGGPTDEQMRAMRAMGIETVAPWEMYLCECSPPGPTRLRLVRGERVCRR